MSDSAETVVRRFFAAFPQSDVDELISFFNDEAVYIDGPRGVHRGIEAIRSEFATQVQMVPSTTVDIKILVANGGAVMVERAEQFAIAGNQPNTKWWACSRLMAMAESRAGATITT